MNIVAEGPDLVIHQPDEALAHMDQVVIDMHTRSGLLDAIKTSTLSLADAGAQVLAYVQQHVGPVALVVRVRLHARDYVEIARGPTRLARLALALEARIHAPRLEVAAHRA